jgi:hypothetical protein
MVGKGRLSRFLIGAALLAAIEFVVVVAVGFAVSEPARAQYRDDRYPFAHRQRSGIGGFFGDLFGNPGGYRRYQPYEQPPEQRSGAEHMRAPPPHKVNKEVTPTTSIVVLGDGMADWLAYGLEEAFSDQPEVAVSRQNKYNSGLLRYDAKGDLDWWHVARDILTREKANYVVMMLGVGDRENIRERDLAKEAEKQKAESQQTGDKKDDKPDGKTAADKGKPPADSKSIAAPEPKKSNGVIEFRSDQWAAVYSKRIDETIAALKSKGVPVFWVGLPSIRGAKSTADAVYLNELYRARAERAGIVYIDVWDGFVDDAGKFSSFGPDYEGQMRRLRSADGVYFTKYGARKLAHYVEREIRRYMTNRVPVALPTGPVPAPTPATPGKPAARPVAGPVVPLTVATGTADQLLGAAGTRPAYGDATAADVLVKGEPLSAPRGRADDFTWQGGESTGLATAAQPPPAAPAPALARGEPANTARQAEPPGASAPQANNPPPPAPAAAKPAPPASVAANPPTHRNPPRRHAPFPFNPFGIFR